MKKLAKVEGNPIDIQIFISFITTPKPQRLRTLERLKDYITISWNFDAQLTLRGNIIYYLIFSGKEFQKMSFKILN